MLLDNTPDYVFALCGAGLVGAALVGLNHTRRDEHLARDISHTDVQLADHRASPSGAARKRRSRVWTCPGGILVSERFADADDPPDSMGESLDGALDAVWDSAARTARSASSRID